MHHRAGVLVLAAAVSWGAAVLAPPASAHRTTTGGHGGISVPSPAHGQMEIYARHWGEIMRFAELRTHADERFRRIFNHARIQKAWCLWGLVPGAISDEESPFNECSHAYLADARALLETLRADARPGSDIDVLATEIDLELVAAGVPSVCGFSGEDFDTADHVVPDWRALAPPASLVAATGLAAAGLAIGIVVIRSRRAAAGGGAARFGTGRGMRRL